MDPATRRADRKRRLKILLDRSHEIERNVDNNSLEESLREIKIILKAANDILIEATTLDHVDDASESVLDVHLIKLNHEILLKILKKTQFGPEEFEKAIDQIVCKDGVYDWKLLAAKACAIPHTIINAPSLLGSVIRSPADQNQKEKHQRRRTQLAEEKRPENVTNLTRKDVWAKKVNRLAEQVKVIYQKNNCESIPYYKLIIDPKSFTETVENAFLLSFLVRDNKIAIGVGEDDYPTVSVVDEQPASNDGDTTQAISTINLSIFKKMIKFYNIRKPMLTIDRGHEDVSKE